MNYRHIYHAGNFADVMKHMAITLVIDHFKKKETPFCVIDAHGGCGMYDLNSVQAMKTHEADAGIGRFENVEKMPEDFRLYYDLIKKDLTQKHYPGSPAIAARMLRDQDRIIANELHPEDFETLKSNLRKFHQSRVTHLDAYECIRANSPPKEKRGVVVIDPPFEKTDEFETLIKQMDEWKKRFATGTYVIWYPVKAHLAVSALKNAARALALPRTWCVETLVHLPRQQDTFNGCGLILFNAPYMVPERMAGLLPFLKAKMGLFDTPHEWLVEG